MKNQMIISSDTFYISERLKEIDESYFLIFNFDKNKFEVHSSCQGVQTYCFTVPYNVLDERTIDYALKTRAQNLDEIISQIDKENEELEKTREKDAVKCLKEVMYDS
jgi:hypothetical protein